MECGGTDANIAESGQMVVELAEFQATSGELDLVVCATAEDESFPFGLHEVACAVGALPAEGGEGGVDFGVLLLVEVAAESDSADDEFAGLPPT